MARSYSITAVFSSSMGTVYGCFAFDCESPVPPEHICLPTGQVLSRGGPHPKGARWTYTEMEGMSPDGCVEVTVTVAGSGKAQAPEGAAEASEKINWSAGGD